MPLPRVGEPNRERGTCTWRASYLDVAAHRLGELPDDREPQTCADRAVAVVASVEEEALERARDLIARDPGAGVGDGQLAGCRRERDPAARRRAAQCVLDEVGEGLKNTIGISIG